MHKHATFGLHVAESYRKETDLDSPWDRVDDLLERYDGSVRIIGASECAWSGELRLTLTDPDNAPSRSMTFFSVAHADPEDVAVDLLTDCELWMLESETEPLPVPDWKRELTHDEILRRLNGERPPAETWKPAPGDVLIGEVVDLDEIEVEHGSYPVITVLRDGKRFAWHAKPSVARFELARVAPEVGDMIGIRYDGQPAGRSYHLFRVVLDRPPRIDWARYRKPVR